MNSSQLSAWNCVYEILFSIVQILIVSPTEVAESDAKYRKQGSGTLKLKVGKDLRADIEVLNAIRVAHPDCSFILNAK